MSVFSTSENWPDEPRSLAARSVYEAAEVDAYLSHLERQVSELRAAVAEALGRAEAAEREVARSAWAEALIGRTLVMAERAAARTLAEARAEADALLADARRQIVAPLEGVRRSTAPEPVVDLTERPRFALLVSEPVVPPPEQPATETAAPTGLSTNGHAAPSVTGLEPTADGYHAWSIPFKDSAGSEDGVPSATPTPEAGGAFSPPPDMPLTAMRYLRPTPEGSMGGRPMAGSDEWRESVGSVATLTDGPNTAPTDGPDAAHEAQAERAPTEPEEDSPGVIGDLLDRWRAARTGSIGLFERTAAADEGRGDFLADLRLAVEYEELAEPKPAPHVKRRPSTPSMFEQAAHLVSFPPSLAQASAGSLSIVDQGTKEPSCANGSERPGMQQERGRSLSRLGLFFLSVVSPSSMAHRRRASS